MKHSSNLRALLLAGACLFSQLANADDGPSAPPAPNYLGASIGSASSNGFCTGLENCGESGRSWKAYSGVRITDKIIMEGGHVQFGDQQGSNGTTTTTSSTKGYTAAGVITYPLDQLELFGKAGMWWWKNETATPSSKQATDGNDLFYGAGVSYDLGGNMGVRAEWERYEMAKGDSTKQSTDLIAVGVTFSSL